MRTGVNRVDTLLSTSHFVTVELVIMVILPNESTSDEFTLRVSEDSLSQHSTPLGKELRRVIWGEHMSCFAPQRLLFEDIRGELLELVDDVFESQGGVGRSAGERAKTNHFHEKIFETIDVRVRRRFLSRIFIQGSLTERVEEFVGEQGNLRRITVVTCTTDCSN
jgi:hypothetical protein